MRKYTFTYLLIASCFLSLFGFAACGDDESNDSIDGVKQVEKSSITGIVEKGPFVQGSKVTLYELTADLLQTGKSFKAQTTNDLGAFRFETPISLKSQFVELETSGYFYNEVRGGLSSSQITLNALSNVENRNSVNVNLMTHLEFDRVKNLVRGGNSFNQAKRQAEKELLACFAITDEIASPEGISITDNNKNSAILLAISTIMLHNKSEAEFSEFIAKFSTDFADNGKIDNSIIREAITEGEKGAYPSSVIERMKEFYANKGVAMECEDFSQFIDFNGDGVINEEDSVQTKTFVVEDDFWNDKNDLYIVLSGCYIQAMQFETAQLKIEGLRTDDRESVHTITPYNNTSSVYSSVYQTINRTNTVIRWAPLMAEKDPSFNLRDKEATIAEAKCLRAFAYYNLAMLWGDVILITEPIDTDDQIENLTQSKQAEVYQFAYTDICEAIDKLPSSYSTDAETKARFTRQAALMLKAEIELTLGRNNEAKNTLENVGNDITFSFTFQEQTIPIYTPRHLVLYKKEADGNTEGLETEWAAMTESRYGYWAALKRLGKAQEVTGCYDYELLMPFPYEELRYNPNITQNPGYSGED